MQTAFATPSILNKYEIIKEIDKTPKFSTYQSRHKTKQKIKYLKIFNTPKKLFTKANLFVSKNRTLGYLHKNLKDDIQYERIHYEFKTK